MKNTHPIDMADFKVVERCGIKARDEKQEEIKARIERELKQCDTIPLERCDLLKEKGAR